MCHLDYKGFQQLGAFEDLTEIFPEKHGGDQIWVIPSCLNFFLVLLQLLRRQLRLDITIVSDGLGVDARVKQCSVFPQNEGIQNGDADWVNLTRGNNIVRVVSGGWNRHRQRNTRLLNKVSRK